MNGGIGEISVQAIEGQDSGCTAEVFGLPNSKDMLILIDSKVAHVYEAQFVRTSPLKVIVANRLRMANQLEPLGCIG